MNIRIERLSEKNLPDYEKLTSCESGGGCYCSFWHQKWTSMADWEKCKKETPGVNRQIVLEKMRSGFHVGVLAYQGDSLAAWISVGPLIDFYWTWKRAIQVGEAAKSVAGILCFTVAPASRGQGLQSKILEALREYGKSQGWSAIEGYPFDDSALEKQKENAVWPGLAKGFIGAGFTRQGAHWLTGPGWERSIYRADL
ncbi:MAG: hypothetical protein HUU37_01525 [Bdellovibrionales bacterium]|nr:hypothetical protein [Bdellovibrionales bacterium]